MNKQSLYYKFAKDQEIINDPFDLGQEWATGVAKMQRTLYDYAEELVSQYAVFKDDIYDLNLDSLSDSDRYELGRLFVEESGRDLSDCLYGEDFTPNNDFTTSLLAMLADNSFKTREQFARITLENIILYYKKSIQEILDHACDIYYHDALREQGLRSDYDYDQGDVVWRKSA